MLSHVRIRSTARLVGAVALLVVASAPVLAAQKPSPYNLGQYIGWLMSCGAISGSQSSVGRALRHVIERRKLWGYTEQEIDTLVDSLRFGIVGRSGWDNGEVICAKLRSNKESVENIKKLIELGRQP